MLVNNNNSQGERGGGVDWPLMDEVPGTHLAV